MAEVEMKDTVVQKQFEIIYENLAKLKKENAELKDKLEVVISVGNTCLNDLNKELTKAKELLTKWVELFRPKGGNIPPTQIQVETEQFLLGVKNEKAIL